MPTSACWDMVAVGATVWFSIEQYNLVEEITFYQDPVSLALPPPPPPDNSPKGTAG